jgi:hypothetical protein
MPATENNSAFLILFNFSTAAERPEFYFRHFGNASTLGAISSIHILPGRINQKVTNFAIDTSSAFEISYKENKEGATLPFSILSID